MASQRDVRRNHVDDQGLNRCPLSGVFGELKMETLQISAQLLNSIIGYLGTRPYQEVFQLVQSLQKEVANQSKPEGAAE